MKGLFMHKNEEKVWEQLKEKMKDDYETNLRESAQLREKLKGILKGNKIDILLPKKHHTSNITVKK